MRKAFTFLELIIVVVIVAILSVIALQYLYRPDYLVEVVDRAISDLRYTQHLALSDDKYEDRDVAGGYAWEKTRWKLQFAQDTNGLWLYRIFADRYVAGATLNGLDGVPQDDEYAIDPLTHQFLAGGDDDRFVPALSLGKNMEITNVVVRLGSGFKPQTTIMFDERGKPITQSCNPTFCDPAAWVRETITITFTHRDGESMSICILPITGFVDRC
ncbi:hypothetical protein FACS1894103_0330 [Campylobacterota bacterium]|nr:hypothetical protein FACS1894103_0330 [Campylobacterota bacterium]